MSDKLRQRLYEAGSFERLRYEALLGKWSKDEYSEADGTLPDVSYKVVFGDSGNLSAGIEAEVWPLSATANMDLPTSAEILDIVSSSVQDDIGGSGIDSVFIEGLDEDFQPISELVILDGTATVNSTLSYIHVSEVNCLNITTSGVTNAGNITITNTTSGDSLGYVKAGDSISKHGQFLVPAGYNAIMLGGNYSVYRASGSGARRARIDLELAPVDGGNGDRINYRSLKLGGTSEGALNNVDFSVPFVIGEKLFIHPTATAEANNTQVSIDYALLLIRTTIDIDSVF